MVLVSSTHMAAARTRAPGKDRRGRSSPGGLGWRGPQRKSRQTVSASKAAGGSNTVGGPGVMRVKRRIASATQRFETPLATASLIDRKPAVASSR